MEWNFIDRKTIFIYFAAITANMMTGLAGMGYAWTSPVLPKLNGNDTSQNPLGRPTTLLEDSWIVSLQSLGAMSGPLFTGTISSRIGHKNTLLLYSIPCLISSVILMFANQIVHFYAARFLLGIGTGCALSLIPIYVAEISDVSNRGATSCCLVMMLNGFLLVVYAIGPYVTIRILAIMSAVMAAAFMTIFGLFVPESPYFLVSKGKMNESKAVLKKLRSSSTVEKDFEEIIEVVKINQEKVPFTTLFKSKLVTKCLFIGVGLSFFQQSNGVLAVFAYMQTIFEAAQVSLEPSLSVVIIGFIQTFTNIIILKVVGHIKRRKLLLISYIGILCTQVCLGSYFLLLEKGHDLESVSWIPLVCISLYSATYAAGAGPVTFTLIGEIFPLNLKSYLSSISAFFNILVSFLVSLLFPSMYLPRDELDYMDVRAVCHMRDNIYNHRRS